MIGLLIIIGSLSVFGYSRLDYSNPQDNWVDLVLSLNQSGNNITVDNLKVDGYIKVGDINPTITENRVMAEGSIVSHGGFSGKNTGWEPYFKMFSTSSPVIKSGNNGEFDDSNNIFCDYTADNFSESDATRPTKVLTILNGTYLGAIAEINAYINSSCVSLEKNPGWDTDVSGIKWSIKSGLKINFNDGESYKFVVGNDEKSYFKIGIPNATNDKSFYIYDVAGVDNRKSFSIDTDMNGKDGIIGQHINLYSDVTLDNTLSTTLLLEGDGTNMKNSKGIFIDMKLIGQPTNSHIDAIRVDSGVDHIIHMGSADTLNSAYVQDGATTKNETYNFTAVGAGATMFNNNNDYVYIGNTLNFTSVAFALDTVSSRNLNFEYYYCNGSSEWETLAGVTDTTNGMKVSGTITFVSPSNRGTCNQEYDGTAFSDTTNYTYIALKRTLNNNVNDPVENLVSIGGGETYFLLQKDMLKLDGSNGAPVTCSASYAGAYYYDETSVELLWCDGSSWQPYAEAGDVTAHNSLSGLQGGTATEYYHLTSAQHTLATGDNYLLNTGDTATGDYTFVGNINVTGYSYVAGLYTCNNGTATIMTRNKTLANSKGCSI